MFAIAFLIVVLARPQFGSKKETVTRQGIETVIALDISNSMLAEDIAPNRLEKAKNIISKLIDKFENDKVGLIVFAGDAFVQLPITNDFISAKMFLESITPSLISRQGTDIGAAINLAMKSFTPNEEVGKAIIVITDGENHEGGAEDAAKAASEKGIAVYMLGVGTADGAPIPTGNANEYRKDKDGNIVMTRLNEEMSQNIARAGNGAYIRVDNTNNAQKLLQKEIDKLAKADVTSEVYTEYNEQFFHVAWIVLLLLIIDILVLPGKSRFTRNIKLFSKQK
jgi:Ca-activated chloride channel family protein